MVLTSLRFSVATIVFGLIYFKKINFKNRETIQGGIVLGVLMFLGYGFQTLGLMYTTAARSGFITFSYALYVPFLQYYFLKKKPVMGNLIGLFFVAIGVAVLSNPESAKVNVGDILTLCSAIVFAFYVVFIAKYTTNGDPTTLTLLQFIIPAILAACASPFVETPFIIWSDAVLLSVAYLAVPGTIICIYLMNINQRETSPMRAVIIYDMEPLFAVVLAVFLLNETLDGAELIGISCII